MGTMSRETSFEILDFFYKSGGNFIDTANNYQNEESEKWIGEWMQKHNNRAQMVIATKFTTGYNTYDSSIGIHGNFSGNHSKSLRESVEASLKKLQTDYIDLLYVHWWDYTTSIPELMQSLNHLVQSGKVLYLGISDTPAWIVSKANQYAADHGLRGFCAYQGNWNASTRDMERDIIPMAMAEGMAIVNWNAVGGGKFKTEEQIAEMEKAGEKGRSGLFGGPSENDKKVTKVLARIGQELGKSLTAVALAYCLTSHPYVHPIIGGRKVSHLKDNIEALTISLTEEQLDEINSATNFDLGFPHNFIGQHPKDNFLVGNAAVHDFMPLQKAIGRK